MMGPSYFAATCKVLETVDTNICCFEQLVAADTLKDATSSLRNLRTANSYAAQAI